MACHIPFAYRRRGVPVYIGFDEPLVVIRPRRGFNGWGLASFLTLLLSAGVLAPLSLLLGLFGLRRSPRTLATFSTLVSGAISGLMALGLAAAANHHYERQARWEHEYWMRQQQDNIHATDGLIRKAEDELLEYQLSHGGQLPADYDGMLLTVAHPDAWKNPLRYEVGSGNFYIRSAGPDQAYETDDDIRHRIGSTPTSANAAGDFD